MNNLSTRGGFVSSRMWNVCEFHRYNSLFFCIESATKGVCNKNTCLAEGSAPFACTFSDSSMNGRSSLLQRKPTRSPRIYE